MNYGKIAYSKLQEYSDRLRLIEKKSDTKYSTILFNEQVEKDIIGNFVLKHFDFFASQELSAYFELNVYSTFNSSVIAKLFLDGVCIYEKTLSQSDINSGLMKISIDTIKAGKHNMYVQLYSSVGAYIEAVSLSVVGMGISKNKIFNIHNITSFDSNIFKSRLQGNKLIISNSQNITICAIAGVLKYDKIMLSGSAILIAYIDKLHTLNYLIVNSQTKQVLKHEVVDSNVLELSVCTFYQNGIYIISYVKKGCIYLCMLTENYCLQAFELFENIKGFVAVNLVKNSYEDFIITAMTSSKMHSVFAFQTANYAKQINEITGGVSSEF